jgi:hypothetical protein
MYHVGMYQVGMMGLDSVSKPTLETHLISFQGYYV